MSEDFKLSGVSKKNHKFIKREPTFVHYQSLDADGNVWCEGRNPNEVIGRSLDVSKYTK